MRIKLSVIAGPHAGAAYAFDHHDTFLVGRSRHAHFQLPAKDKFFSRIHFMMEVNPPHCRLIDMGSHNGTYVNGQRVLMTDLSDGDQIRAGHTIIRLSVHADEGPPDPDATTDFSPELVPVAADVPTLPGYANLRELSRQSRLGPLYLANRQPDGEPVVVKMVMPSFPPTPMQAEEFLRSVRILRRLEHPHIVRLFDLGAGAGGFWFASEYVPGIDAAALVGRDGPLSVRRAIRWANQLLQALKFAHALKLIHCAIKPSNILVGEANGQEVVKLADFGISRAYQSAPFSGLSFSADVLTAAAYLPPELVLDYQHAQPSADQYAVAATLYFLLTGTHILDLPREVHRRFSSLLRQVVVPIRDRRPEVPPGVADAIHRALARAPGQRFKDVTEFRLALVKAAQGD